MREAFELGLSDLCGTDELESAATGAVATEGEESSWTVVIVRYNEQRTVSMMMMMEGIKRSLRSVRLVSLILLFLT